ncbi:hypothetical protein NADFUDRAFT_46262 [Nadsonia fulvescens var. elongata DSM 6958]|uniref:GST C-terminal domain-containing protein n=1 Tax=Nadsonia fulvescens var. elongata DSM 6958 TaxID=857566 RepID=A0A1E3PJQ5_9ASCO|nr:hypothetical protein NADFUDRAFT_46262 [Nadsonia fulvescens var. elongata DSM 6958]
MSNLANPTSTEAPKKPVFMDFAAKDGEYKRKASSFRDQISRKAGAKFAPEKGRYHLYVSFACPWAHRTLITRKLKGLEDIIYVSVVDWFFDNNGWRFDPEGKIPGSTKDDLYNVKYLGDLYRKAEPGYEGRFTVPVLWDKKTETIVNNESSEIIRMLFTEFDDIIDEKYRGINYYPENLRSQIDEINGWIYDDINNGVYKTGFATKQEVYEDHVTILFKSLDRIETILKNSDGPYLLGKEFTEADLRLYPTIVRFDPVYVQHFKCNIGMIRHDFPHIHKWLRHLYWDIPAFKDTTNFEHIKNHYSKTHVKYNPFGITPLGPVPHIYPKEK